MNRIVSILYALSICILIISCGKKVDSASKLLLGSISRPSLDAGSISSFPQEQPQDSTPAVSNFVPGVDSSIKKPEVVKPTEKDSVFGEKTDVVISATKPQIKKAVAKDVTKAYEGLRARSERYYRKSLDLVGTDDDSALYYAMAALQLFENGSIFRVKAQALFNLRAYVEAEIACDVCGERKDHWNVSDIAMCAEIKCESLQMVYQKYPSTESKKRYEKACSAADTFIH